jgi:Leucine-rich repeat (LRR) protein
MKVTDAGIRRLARLKNLRSFSLRNNIQLTDVSVKVVASFAKLESLDLPEVRMTDATSAHVAGLKHLQKLAIAGTDITDAGLRKLLVLNELTNLDIRDGCKPSLKRTRFERLRTVGEVVRDGIGSGGK